MHIERIHKMIECLTEKALAQLEGGVENVDTSEFGEVTDMIKDLNEAEYYAKISKAMDESDEDEIMEMLDRYGDGRRYYDHYRYADGRFAPKGRGSYRRGYEEPPYYHMTPEMYRHMEEYRDMDRGSGRMYYTEPSMSSDSGSYMESRYDMAKRNYTESKELHRGNTPDDKEHKMKELEKYTKELASDLAEIVTDASQEERTLLKQKLQVLIQKIQ